MKIMKVETLEGLIAEFAEYHDLTMEIYIGHFGEYSAHFAGTRVKGAEYIFDIKGYGWTEQAAIANYAKRISERTLVFNDNIIQAWKFI